MAEAVSDRALTEVTVMPRNDSSVWDWQAGSPPPSQGASLHNGNVFAPDKQASPPVSRGNSKHKGNMFGPDGQLLVSSMKKSPSTLWFWETKESSLPSSRNNSVRKGTAFSESVFGEHPERPSRNNSLRGGNAFVGGIAEETAAPTNAPMKRNSSFSFLWNWGKYRRDGEDESEDSVAASRTSDPAVMPPKGMMKNRSIGEPNGPPKSRLSRLAHSRALVIMTLTHPFSRRLHTSCILQARTCGAGMRCAPHHLARQVRLGTQAQNSSSTISDWPRCRSITSRNRKHTGADSKDANSIPGPLRERERSSHLFAASLLRRTSLRLPSHRSSCSQNFLRVSPRCLGLTKTRPFSKHDSKHHCVLILSRHCEFSRPPTLRCLGISMKGHAGF